MALPLLYEIANLIILDRVFYSTKINVYTITNQNVLIHVSNSLSYTKLQ